MADTQIPILLPPELLELLNKEAQRSNRSRAAVMRSAMRRGLAEQEAERAGKPVPCERCAVLATNVREALEQHEAES